MRWHTEIAFKEYLSGAIGAKSIQKWSNKQIGEYLKILIEEYKKWSTKK